MRKILALLAAVTALLSFATVPAQAAATAWAPDMNGYRFWSPNICVDGSAINGTYYRVAYVAQQWNLKSDGVLKLDYENDCAAAGYPPSRRMVIGGFSNPGLGDCLLQTNTAADWYNGMWRWTDGPGNYINWGISSCVSSQSRRDKAVSIAIGNLLGLLTLNSAGYNSRVMNSTAYSWDNVTLPTYVEGDRLREIYTGVWGG